MSQSFLQNLCCLVELEKLEPSWQMIRYSNYVTEMRLIGFKAVITFTLIISFAGMITQEFLMRPFRCYNFLY